MKEGKIDKATLLGHARKYGLKKKTEEVISDAR
jgi:hypothetical protein